MHKQSKRPRYGRNDHQKSIGLEPALKGFLGTCNNREKDAVREAYNILNKYANPLYGAETTESKNSTENSLNPYEDNTSEVNIEDSLEKELCELRNESKNVNVRRFQSLPSGAKNVIFIRTTVEDPVRLAITIFNDIQETRQLQNRFLIKLIPIEVTCKAYIDDIIKACSPLLDKHFKDDDKSFSIYYNRRNNNHLDRDEVIKNVADLVIKSPGNHKVNLTNPDVTIVVEIIKNIALLSVIPGYMKMHKLNLHTAAGETIELKNIEKHQSEKKDVEGKE